MASDPLETVAAMVISAYHKTRMADYPAHKFVADNIRGNLAAMGIVIMQGPHEAQLKLPL